jgi:energy-coupling factor transporter ATP-binding protein EcfA2
MKASNLARSLVSLIQTGLPVMIHGPVGSGKSSLVAQVAQTLKLELRDVRASTLDPVDARGYPVPQETCMKWLPADFLPTKGKGILFFDELNLAPLQVQQSLYQLFLDRKLGSYTLPPGWSIVAAGNRAADRCMVQQTPAALNNRMVHLDMEVDNQDWEDWAVSANVHQDIVGFMRAFPNSLHSYDSANNPRAFPTPRSWAFVNTILKAAPPNLRDILCGTIGEGTATMFMAYLDEGKDLPTLAEVLAKPDSSLVPHKPSGLFAVVTMLEFATDAKNFATILSYVERMPVEMQAVYVKNCLRKNRNLAATAAFRNWGEKNDNLLHA